MSEDKEIVAILSEFCNVMKAQLPEQRIIEDYFSISKGFNIEIIKAACNQWRYQNAFRFPSPKEFQEILIETAQAEEFKGGPRTITDLFGNRTRVETPLAREFCRIMRALIGTPIFRAGKMIFSGCIRGKEAIEMVEEAEILYGPAHEPFTPRRKSPDECLKDAGADEALAIRAIRKHEHKRNDHEKDELRKIARALLPYGYAMVTATEDELKIGKIDDDAWHDSFGLLNDYAERI